MLGSIPGPQFHGQGFYCFNAGSLLQSSSFEALVVSGMKETFVLSGDHLERVKVINEEYKKRLEDKRNAVKLQEQIRQPTDYLGNWPRKTWQVSAIIFWQHFIHPPPVKNGVESFWGGQEEESGALQQPDKTGTGADVEEVLHWEEREAFATYCAGEQTEEVLEAHQDELERLKKHPQENKTLLNTQMLVQGMEE